MTEINDHIIEYLDYYCELSSPPKFAVLIKGEWGSGKTWLVEKYIEEKYKQDETINRFSKNEIHELARSPLPVKKESNSSPPNERYELGHSPLSLNKSKSSFSEKNLKPLYISLYGVASLSEIDDLIFSQLHPILSSKALKLGSKILVGALKATIKVDLNSDGNKDESLGVQIPDIKLPEYLKDTSKCILVFDDLERCNIEIINLLGYINYFVEHQNLKVIIIANEDEIIVNNKNNTDAYKKTKEKLIGKTFSAKTDFNGALIYFIKDIQNKDIKSFLENNSGLIKNFFDNAKCQNLRTLHQIILDFERIYKSLPTKALGKEILLQDLLRMLMCFSLEIKRNNMSEKDILDLFEASTNLQRKNYFKQQGKNLEEEKYQGLRKFENLEPIIAIYSQLNFSNPSPSLAWWSLFFNQGKIDREYLAKSIEESKYFVDENTPIWKKLYFHTRLSDKDFDDYLHQVKKDFDDKNFGNDIGVFIHITILLIHLSEIGLFEQQKSEILQEANTYIQKLENDKDPILRSSLLDQLIKNNFEGHHQLVFSRRDKDDFKQLTSSLIKAFNTINISSLSQEAEELLDIMKDDPYQFCYMISLENFYNNRDRNRKRYHDIPILTHLTPQKIVDKLLEIDSYENQQLIFEGLKERYQFVKKENDSMENKCYKKDESEQRFDQNIINNLATQPELGLYTSSPTKPDALLEELDILKDLKELLLKESEKRKQQNSGYKIKTLVDGYLNEIIANLENCLPQK